MAKADPKVNAVIKYLRDGFSKQEDLDLSCVLDDSKSRVKFTYKEVKAAMFRFKIVDPGLHSLLGYLWQSHRSRNAIAEALHFDSSTVRRRWVKGITVILNYLINEEVTADIDPIDIRMIEAKENGTLVNA